MVGVVTTTPLLADYLDRFARRIVLDALNEATAAYWRRRADQLEAARWKPGDYTGHATAEDLAAHDRAVREVAEACRNRAALLDTYGGEIA